MIGRNDLEQVLQGLSLGPLRILEQVGSTNSEALAWADGGAPDLSLVLADEQTAGRGRQGRRWFTPSGAALAFSLVLRSGLVDEQGEQIPSQLARLTGLGALAVCQALEGRYNLAAQIKWPNDVLLGGRKVCGILTETQWLGERLCAVVLGIGVNVRPASVPPDSEVIYPATSVESVLGRVVDRWQLLRSVLEYILAWRSRLSEQEFLTAWEDRLAFRGQQVSIFTDTSGQDAPDEQGLLMGLDEAGRLLIRRYTGEVRSMNFGELRLRPDDPDC